MKVSVPSLPVSWNPDSATDATSAQLVRDVEAPLLQLTPHTQQAAAGIARSWKYDKARTRLTVGIRPKAAFSDGAPVTPKDVVFSVDQWLKGPERGAFYSGLISSVAAHGKDSVVFTLDTPSSALVDALTLSSSAIIPDDFGGDTAADFYTHPVGAGPFAIGSTSSDTIHLKRNKHFYEKGHPYLSAIDYRVVSDPAAALQQVSGGKTDLAEGVPASELSSGHKHARVVTTPSQSTSVVTFSSKSSPATDPKLRKAVSLAIDRSALVKSVYDGKADVAKGLLPGNVQADQGCSSCDWSQHDVSLAKSDVASLPHLGGLTLLVDSGQPSDVRTAQAITPMLAQAGITVRTVPVNAATMAARLASGSYEMALRTLSVQTPTPADSLQTLVRDHYVADGTSTQAAGTALQAVNAATDLQGTSSAVAAFEQQNFTTAAVVPLVDPDVVDVVSTRVRGLALLPSGLYHSAALWLKN
jgi:peptide/nickel transport system substrate-binding protein